jgi:hypothetical protein
MDEYLQLPPSARAKRYRSLVGDARRAAEKIDGEVRGSYLMLADQWDVARLKPKSAPRLRLQCLVELLGKIRP